MSYISHTFLLFGGCSVLVCCVSSPSQQENDADILAQEIIDQAILASGGSHLDSAHFSFDFRNRTYHYKRNGDAYEYTRILVDADEHAIKDVLNNAGLTRYDNGIEVNLEEKKRQAYTNSVNSVIYFALLPYGLNDEAVIKQYEGDVEVRGTRYHQVRIMFRQEGGGTDFQDNFLYWFDVDDASMDYMAYDYETNGGGVRFREAFNVRKVGGFTFQDYLNYKPSSDDITLDGMLESFKGDELTLLSKIELDAIHDYYKIQE